MRAGVETYSRLWREFMDRVQNFLEQQKIRLDSP